MNYPMPAYTLSDLLTADRSWRINFVNSLIGPKNLHVLITRTDQGVLNAAIFNSGIHVGSSPPYVGFLLRPTTVPRHTYWNLRQYPYATFNLVSESFYSKAHATHQKFSPAESELEHLEIPLRWESGQLLPYIEGSPVVGLLRLVEEHFITVNHTRLLLFAIEKVQVEQEPDKDGFLRLDTLGAVAGSGCDAYWKLSFLERLPLSRSTSS
ncbi:MAG: flavin reductase [Bacteroidia bacterium]|nr:flavin reductase [Bacteroidia bacterium]